jgi:hypothetical protein
MGNRRTKPHVTALAMYCTPDIVTVSLTIGIETERTARRPESDHSRDKA